MFVDWSFAEILRACSSLYWIGEQAYPAWTWSEACPGELHEGEGGGKRYVWWEPWWLPLFFVHSWVWSHCHFPDKLRDALKKKDLELAEAQKTASDKTKLAEEKLASISKLEEENTNLKAALDTANRYASRLKSDKLALSDKASELAGKKNDLDIYLGGLAKKLFLMLEGNPLYPTGNTDWL